VSRRRKKISGRSKKGRKRGPDRGFCGLCGKPLKARGCPTHGEDGASLDRPSYRPSSSQSGAQWLTLIGVGAVLAAAGAMVSIFDLPLTELRWFAFPALILSTTAFLMRYDAFLAERWGLRECRACGEGSAPEALYCAHCSKRLSGAMFNPHRTENALKDGNLARRRWFTGPAGVLTVILIISTWGLAGFSAYHLQTYGNDVDLSISDASAVEGVGASGGASDGVYTVAVEVRNSGGATADRDEISIRLSWEEVINASAPGGILYPEAAFGWKELGGGDLEFSQQEEVEVTLSTVGSVDAFHLTLYHDGREQDAMYVDVE
jgi:hypothetical protein